MDGHVGGGSFKQISVKRIDSPAVYMGGGPRAPPRDGSGGSELGTAGTSWSIVPLMGEKKKRQDEATGSTMLKLFVRFLFQHCLRREAQLSCS